MLPEPVAAHGGDGTAPGAIGAAIPEGNGMALPNGRGRAGPDRVWPDAFPLPPDQVLYQVRGRLSQGRLSTGGRPRRGRLGGGGQRLASRRNRVTTRTAELASPQPMISPTRSSPMTITITAFERLPMAARDWRAIRAFAGARRSGPTLRGSPGFVPCDEGARTSGASSFRPDSTYQKGDLALFETGAIVFHIAERHAGRLPDDPNARARAITWMFAALNTGSRLSLNSKPRGSWRATRPGMRSACLWSRIASATRWTNFRSPGRCRLARRRVQRGDLMTVSVLLRFSRRAFSTNIRAGRLCGPRRGAARRQASFRGQSGGLYQAPKSLTLRLVVIVMAGGGAINAWLIMAGKGVDATPAPGLRRARFARGRLCVGISDSWG